jgi:hypothetical protein
MFSLVARTPATLLIVHLSLNPVESLDRLTEVDPDDVLAAPI